MTFFKGCHENFPTTLSLLFLLIMLITLHDSKDGWLHDFLIVKLKVCFLWVSVIIHCKTFMNINKFLLFFSYIILLKMMNISDQRKMTNVVFSVFEWWFGIVPSTALLNVNIGTQKSTTELIMN